jgi:activating signal cointegrator 1
MKALTLHEPWASLIAYGWKEVETRDWYTSYRGPLAIHAALRQPDPTELSHVTFALGHRVFKVPPLTFGAVVCVCQLAACLPAQLAEVNSTKLKPLFTPRRGWEVERLFGNFGSGRWAWILRDVQRLDRPLAARGMRKLWNWQAPSVNFGFVSTNPQAPVDLPTARPFVMGTDISDISTDLPISSPAAKVVV